MIQVKQKSVQGLESSLHFARYFLFFSQKMYTCVVFRPRPTPFNQINLNIMITKIGNMATKITFCRVGLWRQLKQVTRGTANT